MISDSVSLYARARPPMFAHITTHGADARQKLATIYFVMLRGRSSRCPIVVSTPPPQPAHQPTSFFCLSLSVASSLIPHKWKSIVCVCSLGSARALVYSTCILFYIPRARVCVCVLCVLAVCTYGSVRLSYEYLISFCRGVRSACAPVCICTIIANEHKHAGAAATAPPRIAAHPNTPCPRRHVFFSGHRELLRFLLACTCTCQRPAVAASEREYLIILNLIVAQAGGAAAGNMPTHRAAERARLTCFLINHAAGRAEQRALLTCLLLFGCDYVCSCVFLVYERANNTPLTHTLAIR